jgi:PD-(D/E)XK nuclease superfamily
MKMYPPSSQNHCKNIPNTPIKNMPTQVQKRFSLYTTVASLAEPLANEKDCQYALWQRTHYQFEKQPSTYDHSEHEEMLIKRAIQLQDEGFTVYVENQNSFKYRGQIFDICVAGRPDIIAIKDNWAVVEDIKTGKRKDSHKMQVLLYMSMLPFAPETQHLFKGHIPHGRLVYRDGILDFPKWSVDREFRQRLQQLIAMLCNYQPPNSKPSNWECRYCQIPSAYCSAKLDRKSDLCA